MSGVSIDSYQKLNSGESFLKLKEFHEEVIKPITMNFFISEESEKYLLKAMMCFVNISMGSKARNLREEDFHRAAYGGPAVETVHQDEEILDSASDSAELCSD